MSQSLACPHCGKNYVISERYSGASVKCQFCGERFRVPEEELIPDAVFVDESDRRAVRSGAGKGPANRASRAGHYAPAGMRMGREPHRIVAAVLAFLLGIVGVHHFYTGQTSKGMHCLVWPFFTCGLALGAFAVLGMMDAFRYLTMSDQEWLHRWQNYAL